MDRTSTIRPTPQLVLGIVVIIVGILFTLDNLEILSASHYLRFWPLILIAVGMAKFFDSVGRGGRLIGILFLGAGSVLLLKNLNVFSFRLFDLWPLILVIIGGGMLYQAVVRHAIVPADADGTISAIAILGGVERTIGTQDFRGGELTAVMGGCEIDLRDAAIQQDEAVLNIFAFWGGIELKVPENWIVVVQGFPIMGGFEEHTHPTKDGPQKRLLIKGFVIMGGVEIRN